MNWTGVPKEFLHGHLIGYQLSYSPANQLKSSLTLMVPPRTTHKLQHLSVFTLYVIHVSAVNMKGAGPKSAPVMARTGESGIILSLTPTLAPPSTTMLIGGGGVADWARTWLSM